MVPAPDRPSFRGVVIKLTTKPSLPRFVSLATSRSLTYTTMMTTTFPRNTRLNMHGSTCQCSNPFAASSTLNVFDHNNPALAENIFSVLSLPKLPPPAQISIRLILHFLQLKHTFRPTRPLGLMLFRLRLLRDGLPALQCGRVVGSFLGSRRIMSVSPPPPPLPPPPFNRRVTGNCLSGVGCGVPCGPDA